MHSYDLFILAIIGASLVWGAWKGLAWQVMSIGSIFVSYFVAANFYEPVAQNIVPRLFDVPQQTARYIAMGLVYVASSLVMWLGFNFIRDSIERFRLKEFDRQIGGLVGAGKGGLLSILITLFTVGVSEPNTRRAVFQSKSGGVIAQVLQAAAPMIPGDYRREIAPYVRKLEEGIEQEQGREGHGDYENRYEDEGNPDDPQYRNEPYAYDDGRGTYPDDGYSNDPRDRDADSGYDDRRYPRRRYDDEQYDERSYNDHRTAEEDDWEDREDDRSAGGSLLDTIGEIGKEVIEREFQKSRSGRH
jgi:membrane protein required for colicin V production